MINSFIIAVTGTAAGDRRGMLVAGLAKRFACEADSVLVVDAADSGVSGRLLGLLPSPARLGYCELLLRTITPFEAIIPAGTSGVAYLPSGPGLMNVDSYADAEWKDLVLSARAAACELGRHHCVVILDTGNEPADPSTFCALAGADVVLIAAPDRAGDPGTVAAEVEDVDIVREEFNPSLRLAGMVGVGAIDEESGLFSDYNAVVDEAYQILCKARMDDGSAGMECTC